MNFFSAPLPAAKYWRAVRALALTAVLAALLAPPAAHANGWQWHSIPRDSLLAGLADESPAYRSFAARAFGYRRDREVIGRLIAMLDSADETVPVKTEIMRALGRIGDRGAVPALTRILRQDEISKLREEAADALGELAAPETLPELLEALERERDLVVLTQVVAALGSFPEPSAIAALSRQSRTAKARTLRRRAILALGRTGSAAAAPPLIEALARARSDRARAEVVGALARTRAPAARAPLIALLGRTTSAALRVHITMALGAIAGGSAAPTLIDLLEDEVSAVRFHAIQGLAQAGDPRAVEPLTALYQRLAERHAGLDAAQILGDPIPYLSALSLRFEIVRALVALNAPAARAVLLDAAGRRDFPRDSSLALRLTEGVYELRRAAIHGLGYSESSEAARFIAAEPLEDRDFRLRAAAVRALGVLGQADVVAALIPRLGDETAEVRWETAFVLGRLGDQGAVRPLLGRLSDDHPEVRTQALLSLGYLGAAAAAAAIEAVAADDAEAKVREAARAALAMLRQGG